MGEQQQTIADKAFAAAEAHEAMSTHRRIQIHSLLDSLSAGARQFRRCAGNLARICNNAGAGHYLRRADRYERLALVCARRLALSQGAR